MTYGAPLATGVAATTFDDTSAVPGTIYFYKVRGVNAVGVGPDSNEASVPVPLPAPTLSVTAAGNQTISLSWTAVPGALSYDLFRSTVSQGYPATPTFPGLVATAFTDGGLVNGTRYFYVVRAVRGPLTSAASNEVSAVPTLGTGNPPNAPVITSPPRKTNDPHPRIIGTADPGAQVTVFFGTSASVPVPADATGIWVYHDINFSRSDGVYIVTATASNASGTSGPSNGVRIEIDTTAPDIPTNLQVVPGNGAAILTWTASQAPDTLGYNIYRKGPLDPDFIKVNPKVVAATSYTDGGLQNGQTYQYRITAVDDAMNEAH
jgi:fibronectin type 3 domain-containing protein